MAITSLTTSSMTNQVKEVSAAFSTFVKQLRQKKGNHRVLLVDNGDILQGQPSAYYYNYVDTTGAHLCARMLNDMGYLCATLGNHDVETGHAVYDKWMDECGFAVLGANVYKTLRAKDHISLLIYRKRLMGYVSQY